MQSNYEPKKIICKSYLCFAWDSHTRQNLLQICYKGSDPDPTYYGGQNPHPTVGYLYTFRQVFTHEGRIFVSCEENQRGVWPQYSFSTEGATTSVSFTSSFGSIYLIVRYWLILCITREKSDAQHFTPVRLSILATATQQHHRHNNWCSRLAVGSTKRASVH